MEFDSAREVVRSIATARSDFGAEQLCYFHYDLIATLGYESDLLFEGKLIDVFATYNLESVHGSPTQWWPEDRGWFVCSDWDLTFTLVGGSEEIIDELISNLDLEAVRVEPTFRIDNQSDQINP